MYTISAWFLLVHQTFRANYGCFSTEEEAEEILSRAGWEELPLKSGWHLKREDGSIHANARIRLLPNVLPLSELPTIK